MARDPTYEVVVVGGGPAGLTTALYVTRLGHRTALVNREGGRYESVSSVHNLIGVSEDVSGKEVTELAIDQLQEYGVDYYEDDVREIEESTAADEAEFENESGEKQFRVDGDSVELLADRVVLATGFADEPPTVRGLERFTGRGLHYCLHCDAYDLGDQSAFVVGESDAAAHAAMSMLNFTDDVDLLLNGEEPAWSEETAERLRVNPVTVVDDRIDRAFARNDADGEEEWLGGLEFADGDTENYGGGFAMHGKEYRNELATDLGCDLADDGSIAVDERRETSTEGVYAVGDVTHGQNQTPIAIGDGAYAGIALHKDLRRFPLSPEEGDGEDDVETPAMPDDLRARMWQVQSADEHVGMVPPDWE
ncbi:NAD(P)/FAD-dependent oxidoreductase [Halomicrococcus sp. NG-SE-24]|uniref:NAD(P)/FAD-dependent oxidoreductase n=1 Tax=Halomicrococcus sp. NG-SE-24 TaxID=3436928 RepID=UPI003D97453B